MDRDHEVILGVLTSRGIASSQDLQSAIGKSQATVSRLLDDLSSQVLTLGRARATRYALPKSIRGQASQQPILWTTEAGAIQAFGTLSFLVGDRVYIDSPYVQPTPRTNSTDLPWFVSPLRAQGFLGRLHARRLEGAGLEGDPDRWGIENVLLSALHLHDAAGAITIGQLAAPALPSQLGTDDAALPAALDRLASDVAHTLPAGSSAGGEQPKFLAMLGDQHLLVKFSPPRGTPFGERWHDLLHAEHLASQVLAEHGVTVAPSRLVESTQRSYLVSERFDRIGQLGRRHVVSIGEVHKAFVPDAYVNWANTAAALARQGRLDKLDAERVAALIAFGRLTGNTDMHSGNFGLHVALEDLAKGRFSLAPLYDMLPMRWRPDPSLGGAPDYSPFEPDAASLSGPAVGPAREFWARLEAHDGVGKGLREAAGVMVGRMGR